MLNEENCLRTLLPLLKEQQITKQVIEIIVVDGGSTDASIQIAKQLGVAVIAGKKGRAIQMNTGAAVAKGAILYFLHVDTLPPKGFDQAIINAVSPMKEAGCFQMKFDNNHPMLRFFGWCTRFNLPICRGGDQSLFITKSLFDQLHGFNTNFVVYEDVECIKRIYKKTNFTVLPNAVVTSARKYQEQGTFRVQYHFAVIHLKSSLGQSPKKLLAYYKKHLSS